MKKYLFAMAALLAIAAACTKEETLNDVSNLEGIEYNHNAPVFKATVGEGSKAVLDPADGNKIKWDGTEHISVWNGTQTADYSTDDTGASADFTTTDDFAAAGSYAALYPFDGSAAFSAGSVTTTLPAAQTATAAGFDPAANIAVASSASTSLSFHNAVAYLKFTVPAGMTDLTSVSFKGNSGEKVAGACSVNTSTYALTATGSETATLSGTFTEGTEYFIAVAPQEFTSGYTVAIERTSGDYNMVSNKDVTFTRSEARNIGELWDGAPVVIMEGTALATTTEMTAVPKPTNVTNHDDVFTFRGSLKEGKLTVREKYSGTTVASNITIPADGNYHVMYNKTTGRFRVYSQDIMVHLGKEAPMSGYPVSYTQNSFTGVGDGVSSGSLLDYNGGTTGVSIAVDASGATVTFKNDNENVFGGSGDKGTNSPWVDDDYYPSYGWGRPSSFSNSSATSDSEDVLYTITGLEDASNYDIRICAIRYSSSANLRVASYAIGGDEITIDCGLAAASKLNLTTFKSKIAYFDSISPSSSNIVLKVHSLTRHRADPAGDWSEAYISYIYISKVVYSQN